MNKNLQNCPTCIYFVDKATLHNLLRSATILSNYKCVFIVMGLLIIFHFFSFYIFVAIHFTNVVLKESLELFLYDKFLKA